MELKEKLFGVKNKFLLGRDPLSCIKHWQWTAKFVALLMIIRPFPDRCSVKLTLGNTAPLHRKTAMTKKIKRLYLPLLLNELHIKFHNLFHQSFFL